MRGKLADARRSYADTYISIRATKTMTPEEIKALLTDTLTEFKTGILSEVNRANSGTAAALTKEIQKQLASLTSQAPAPSTDTTSSDSGTQPEVPSGRLSLKELELQIANERKARESLQKQLEDEKASSTKSRKQSALASAVANNKAANAGTLLKLLQYEHLDKVEFLSDGNPCIDGRPLDAFVKDFILSDEGKPFRASSGVNGASSSEGGIAPQGDTAKPKNKEEALAQLHSQGLG